MTQLELSGTLKAVEMMEQGFPTRIPLKEIYTTYKPLLDGIKGVDQAFVNSLTHQEFCFAIVMACGTLGLKWEPRDPSTLQNGKELKSPKNKKLLEGLLTKTEFTQSEWDSCGIPDLRVDHFVRVGDVYFGPVGGSAEAQIAKGNTKIFFKMGAASSLDELEERRNDPEMLEKLARIFQRLKLLREVGPYVLMWMEMIRYRKRLWARHDKKMARIAEARKAKEAEEARLRKEREERERGLREQKEKEAAAARSAAEKEELKRQREEEEKRQKEAKRALEKQRNERKRKVKRLLLQYAKEKIREGEEEREEREEARENAARTVQSYQTRRLMKEEMKKVRLEKQRRANEEKRQREMEERKRAQEVQRQAAEKKRERINEENRKRVEALKQAAAQDIEKSRELDDKRARLHAADRHVRKVLYALRGFDGTEGWDGTLVWEQTGLVWEMMGDDEPPDEGMVELDNDKLRESLTQKRKLALAAREQRAETTGTAEASVPAPEAAEASAPAPGAAEASAPAPGEAEASAPAPGAAEASAPAPRAPEPVRILSMEAATLELSEDDWSRALDSWTEVDSQEARRGLRDHHYVRIHEDDAGGEGRVIYYRPFQTHPQEALTLLEESATHVEMEAGLERLLVYAEDKEWYYLSGRKQRFVHARLAQVFGELALKGTMQVLHYLCERPVQRDDMPIDSPRAAEPEERPKTAIDLLIDFSRESPSSMRVQAAVVGALERFCSVSKAMAKRVAKHHVDVLSDALLSFGHEREVKAAIMRALHAMTMHRESVVVKGLLKSRMIKVMQLPSLAQGALSANATEADEDYEAPAATGLKWRRLETRPKEGTPIHNKDLCEALLLKDAQLMKKARQKNHGRCAWAYPS